MVATGPLSRSVAQNVFFKGLGEILIRLLSFAFIVLVARSLAPDDFGALNFAYSFPLLFIVLADFGFTPLLVREASRDPERSGRIFASLLHLKLLLSVVFLAAVLAGLWWLAPGPGMRRAAYLLAGFMLLNSFTEFCNGLFQARQQMQLEAGVMAWQKLSLLGFGLLALGLGWGLYGVAGAYLAAGCNGLAAAVLILRRRGLITGVRQIDPGYLRYAWRQALPLTLTTLFINLYFRIDMTLLAKMRPAVEVGWYGAAHKCIEVLMVVPAVLVTAVFPGFSRLFVEDRERLRKAGEKILRLLLLLALPLAAGLGLVATPLMRFLFGAGFAAAGPALAWLGVALAFIFLNYMLSYLLICAEQQKINALVSGLAVGVSLAANLLLIPRFGYAGAAAAAAVTETFLFLAYWQAVRRRLFQPLLGQTFLRCLAATACMAAGLWWVRGLHPLLSTALAVLGYGLAAWLLGAVLPEDWESLSAVWKRKTHA